MNNIPPTVRDHILDNPLVAGALWEQLSQCMVALLQKHYTKTQQQAK